MRFLSATILCMLLAYNAHAFFAATAPGFSKDNNCNSSYAIVLLFRLSFFLLVFETIQTFKSAPRRAPSFFRASPTCNLAESSGNRAKTLLKSLSRMIGVLLGAGVKGMTKGKDVPELRETNVRAAHAVVAPPTWA